jgi:2,3-bisphosphoglycerate-independent phosphoglycerate mutase
MTKKPIIVLIRDGWGYRKETTDNAIALGETTFTDSLMERYPNILIDATGAAVGLPDGLMGNSEVGHLTIGSGRIIDQSLVRINKAIEDGSLKDNHELNAAIATCIENDKTLHLIGLIQDEGVHSLTSHLFALLDICKEKGISKICIHAITDGRDSPPTASKDRIETLRKKLSDMGIGDIATISGRYYAMDRDKRWDRTQKAYDAIVLGKCDVLRPLQKCYDNDETDEFIIPRKTDWYRGFEDGDIAIFFNFRTDRTRQLTQAIVEDPFEGFKRTKKEVHFVAMTQFYIPMNASVIFKEIIPKNVLGEVLSKAGKKQLRISETEKYAHVTFFFNGQAEKPFPEEERILVNSPKVATYDLQPEMSAYEITEKVIDALGKDIYDVVIMNIVNGDMVGHTGVVDACLKAAHVVDECVEKIVNKILSLDGTALIFADHGNLEDQTPEWRTSHTKNPVPFIVVSNTHHQLKETGGLKNIAPTVLKLLDIEKPEEMTGESLIIE